MAQLAELHRLLADEASTILSDDFEIGVVRTNSVPHSDDPGITFPNFDAETQSCKVLQTCVLYIDIRRSTELNLEHRPETVAKLYSAFVRAMNRGARHFGGHVRGIIGDRVMVIFEPKNCFVNSVNTAILFNSIAKYVINKNFPHDTVSCGIGIDFGNMLVTKTGIRRHGNEQHNYKNLVWLGRPANVASKLTDLAAKPREAVSLPFVYVARGDPWRWIKVTMQDFLASLKPAYVPARITTTDPYYESFFLLSEDVEVRAKTPPILMTSVVYSKFAEAVPDEESVRNRWFSKVTTIDVPGYQGTVIGGDVIYKAFKR